jgi:mannose-6-phosphate isomerase-like protein (cupin superfamily)
MKFIKLSSAEKFENSGECTVFEYGKVNNIDGCVALINGKYPTQHFILNNECDMVVYVVSGTGKVTSGDEVIELESDDVIFIPKQEKYAWEGDDLKLFISCNPAFTPDQYAEVE